MCETQCPIGIVIHRYADIWIDFSVMTDLIFGGVLQDYVFISDVFVELNRLG